MKSVPVTQSPHAIPVRLMTTGLFTLMLVFATSCQKDPEIVLPEQQAVQVQATMRTSTVLESQVVQHTQWLLDHVAPLIADEAVATALMSGNTNAAVVTAKLQELGFASFEAFAQAFNNSGSAVQTAVSSGILTQEQLIQIAGSHTFNFSAIGDSGGFPCTDQLALDLTLTPFVVGLAASGGPLVSVIAGAVHVASSYTRYKLCLRSTYP